jgi:hypothetical protein
MSRVRKHLSVANLVAGTALFVALSGGAYAATIAGFVGGTGRIQGCVKANGTLIVVKTGKKCAKHTTSLAFNAKGTAGARGANGAGGAPGAKGASGATGAQGVTGPAGSAGAANGFSTQDSPTALIVVLGAGIGTPVASVALPAGNFVVQADVQVENTGTNNLVSCVLAGGGLSNSGVLDAGSTAGGVQAGYIALGGGATFASAGSVVVICTAGGGITTDTAGATLIATQVTNPVTS